MITQNQWNEISQHFPELKDYEKPLMTIGLVVPDKIKYTADQINKRLEEAKEKLNKLGIPQASKMTVLVFLALLDLTPTTEWSRVKNESMTLSNGIMKFVSDQYGVEYKANTRESFRREGINVLLNNNLIILNPDNPNLGPTSPNTHYAIRLGILNKIKAM